MSAPQRQRLEIGGESYADELQPGTRLLDGEFTVESFLESGGFGITYLARDVAGRRVVIKECYVEALCQRANSLVTARSRAQQIEFRAVVRAFLYEALRLSRLTHPNIACIHHVFEENGTAYIAMDYIDGADLFSTLETGEPLEPAVIERILRGLLGAVGFVHDQGVLHRDISPDNILISRTSGEPVLIDFGAARETVSGPGRPRSVMRAVKDGYSPHEFYSHGVEQGRASDLYALGATVYHLITGTAPTNAWVRWLALTSGEADPYQPLTGRVDGYSRGFLEAVDQALRLETKARVQSAAEWLVLITPPKPAVDSLEPAPAKADRGWSRRNLLMAAMILITVDITAFLAPLAFG